MEIKNHQLVGKHITQRQTPNRGGLMNPQYLIMHYTAGRNAKSSADSLCNPASKASAHIVLGRDGSIIQLAPFNVVTWHAGKSQWEGIIGLNSHSIGIEIDNAGLLKKVGDHYESWFGATYPDNEVLLAAHRHGGGVQAWHTYTAVQIERALELTDLLFAHYGLKDVLGHEDIARGRKSDPGPAFPLSAVRSRVQGRIEDEEPHYRVIATSLNIRSGPGAEFAPVALALKKGTELVLLEPADRWSRVEVVGAGTDIEGWVSNQYIEPITAAPAPRGRGVVVPVARAARAAKPAPKAAAKAANGKPAQAKAAPAKKATAKATKPASKASRNKMH